MIKKLFLSLPGLFLLCGLCGIASAGYNIVAVQGIDVLPYEQALDGFKGICNVPVERIVLSETGKEDAMKRIERMRPDLIFAIGRGALSMATGLNGIPVVSVMVMDPGPIISGKRNIHAVRMNVSPERQLDILLDLLPDRKAIGLFYDPEKTGRIFEGVKQATKRKGIQLIARQVHDPRDIPSLIKEIKTEIDLFWMLPDTTVVNPETVRFMFLAFLESRVPILAFSGKYLELGALVSIATDPRDMGRQAGEIANGILSSGRPGVDITQVDARKAVVSINLDIAKKLGIDIPVEHERDVRVITYGGGR